MFDPTGFTALKFDIVEQTNLARDALHVHIGLALFILVRLAWRWRWGWLVAWLVALTAAVGGEWLDWQREIADGEVVNWAAHRHDVWNTMLWPTILALIGRWLEPRGKPADSASEPPPSDEDAEQPFEQT